MITTAAPGLDHPIVKFLHTKAPFLQLDCGPWVAGGAARLLAEHDSNIGASDIDFFFPSEAMWEWACSFVTRDRPGGYRLTDTKSHQLSRTMQFTHGSAGIIVAQFIRKNFFNTVEELFAEMDFTVCMFATDGKSVIANHQSRADAEVRLLRVNNKPSKPQPARLAKYCAKGFVPGPGVLKEMLAVDLPSFTPNSRLQCDDY